MITERLVSKGASDPLTLRRDGSPIDLIWVLLDLRNSRVQEVLDRAVALTFSRLYDAETSVNRNFWNTRALVKIAATEAQFSGRLPSYLKPAILRVYTAADHHQAVAMVQTEEWTGPQTDEE